MTSYREIPPPPDLAHAVRCFWEIEAPGGTPEPIVPDGNAEIVLNLADPFVRDGHERQPAILVAGEMRRPVVTGPSGRVHLLGVSLRPGALRVACPAPAWEIADRMLGAGALHPQLARAAASALQAEPADRLHLLSRALRGHVHAVRSDDPVLRMAAFVAGRQGRVRVDELARLAGVGARQLERSFRDRAGVAPRSLAAVLRFRSVLRALEGDPVSWADVAARAGYADQAHLVRTFRRFTGTTPAAFLRSSHAMTEFFHAP